MCTYSFFNTDLLSFITETMETDTFFRGDKALHFLHTFLIGNFI